MPVHVWCRNRRTKFFSGFLSDLVDDDDDVTGAGVPAGAFAVAHNDANEIHVGDVTKLRNVPIVGVGNVLEIPKFPK